MRRRGHGRVHLRRHDAGYAGVVYLMEAIVGALIVFGAFLYISEDPQRHGVENPDADPVVWQEFHDMARQILLTMKETDVNRGFILLPDELIDRFERGPLLPALLSDADGSAAERWVEAKLPPGARSNLMICRVGTCHVVYADDIDRAMRGTVAEASSMTFLDFEYAFTRPLLDHVAVGADLPVAAVGMDRGHARRSALALDAEVTVLDGDLHEYARTSLRATGRGDANLSFFDGRLTKELLPPEIAAGAVTLAFSLQADPPPSGTITWRVPTGWQYAYRLDAAGWTWTPLTAGTEGPFTMTASRDAAVTSEDTERDLRFTLIPPTTPSRSYDVFPVTFSGGPRGYQELVVTYPTAPDADTPRRVLLSVPDPLPTQGTGMLGLVVASGAESTTVTSVHVSARDAEDVFLSAAAWDASL
ncbi:MAG TPA: hypothetical protein VI997_08700, partial [Candidatus Thermoplasmatota archaeon]|nr:hypothetical protein [Candidatus Thermoplasmatota archaeon]